MTIPPWLNINPSTAVESFLTGISRGNEMARTRLAADQAAQTNREQSAALAARKEEAAYQIAQQFRQEQAKAEAVARQFQGQQEFSRLVQSGVPQDQALARVGASMFYQNPDQQARALATMNAQNISQELHRSKAEQAASREQRIIDQIEQKRQDASTNWQQKQDALLAKEAAQQVKSEAATTNTSQAELKRLEDLLLKADNYPTPESIMAAKVAALKLAQATGVSFPGMPTVGLQTNAPTGNLPGSTNEVIVPYQPPAPPAPSVFNIRPLDNAPPTAPVVNPALPTPSPIQSMAITEEEYLKLNLGTLYLHPDGQWKYKK